jgi:hypothetical protein
LWIDELEKVFAGSGPDSASVDGGFLASARVVSFLDAGTQIASIRRRNLQQRDGASAGVDPQRTI